MPLIFNQILNTMIITYIKYSIISLILSLSAEDKNIVETAVANEAFSTLVTAVQAGELVDALSSEGPFTVFAPTNDAFGKLPNETLESLLDPSNIETLQSLSLIHI